MRKGALFGLLLILSACSSDSTPTVEVNYEGEPVELKRVFAEDSSCSIGVLPDMKSTASLNDQACVQYSDLFRSHFLTVECLPKKGTNFTGIQDAAEQNFRKFAESRSLTKTSDWIELSVDSMSVMARAIDLKAYGSPKPMSYWFAYVDGKESIYSIKLWTLQERKEHFENEANQIIRSFLHK